MNHLNGYHYFNTSDSSNFYSDNSSLWYSEHTGGHIQDTYCSDFNGVPVLDSDDNLIKDLSLIHI